MLCEICGREVSKTTRHHLIPRTRHKNKKNKKDFDRQEVKKTVPICRPCHSQLHAVFTEKELERVYNTLELITFHPEMQKWIKWIKNKPDGFKVPTKKTSR